MQHSTSLARQTEESGEDTGGMLFLIVLFILLALVTQFYISEYRKLAVLQELGSSATAQVSNFRKTGRFQDLVVDLRWRTTTGETRVYRCFEIGTDRWVKMQRLSEADRSIAVTYIAAEQKVTPVLSEEIGRDMSHAWTRILAFGGLTITMLITLIIGALFNYRK